MEAKGAFQSKDAVVMIAPLHVGELPARHMFFARNEHAHQLGPRCVLRVHALRSSATLAVFLLRMLGKFSSAELPPACVGWSVTSPDETAVPWGSATGFGGKAATQPTGRDAPAIRCCSQRP